MHWACAQFYLAQSMIYILHQRWVLNISFKIIIISFKKIIKEQYIQNIYNKILVIIRLTYTLENNFQRTRLTWGRLSEGRTEPLRCYFIKPWSRNEIYKGIPCYIYIYKIPARGTNLSYSCQMSPDEIYIQPTSRIIYVKSSKNFLLTMFQ